MRGHRGYFVIGSANHPNDGTPVALSGVTLITHERTVRSLMARPKDDACQKPRVAESGTPQNGRGKRPDNRDLLHDPQHHFTKFLGVSKACNMGKFCCGTFFILRRDFSTLMQWLLQSFYLHAVHGVNLCGITTAVMPDC